MNPSSVTSPSHGRSERENTLLYTFWLFTQIDKDNKLCIDVMNCIVIQYIIVDEYYRLFNIALKRKEPLVPDIDTVTLLNNVSASTRLSIFNGYCDIGVEKAQTMMFKMSLTEGSSFMRNPVIRYTIDGRVVLTSSTTYTDTKFYFSPCTPKKNRSDIGGVNRRQRQRDEHNLFMIDAQDNLDRLNQCY